VARFDVHRVEGWAVPLVIDVQANLLSGLASRLVVPLVPLADLGRQPMARLEPVVTIEGVAYVFSPTDLSVQLTSRLGASVGNVETLYRDEVVAALDFLFQGF
jgi:toxin CcdB